MGIEVKWHHVILPFFRLSETSLFLVCFPFVLSACVVKLGPISAD